MVWLPEGLVPVGSLLCPNLLCLFPKNSDTGLGTLRSLSSTPSSPYPGLCLCSNYRTLYQPLLHCSLGDLSKPPREECTQVQGTPTMTDPSVNCPWGLSCKFHGFLCRTG